MKHQPIGRWAAVAALAGGIVLSGCGSTGGSAPSASAPVAATDTATPVSATATQAPAAAPASLRGSWSRTMRPKDWKAAGSGYPLGTWRMVADRKGELDVYFPRKRTVDFTAAFRVDGKRLTIEAVPVCPGKTGTYRWSATERALTLAVVADGDCAAGAALFGGTWHRGR